MARPFLTVQTMPVPDARTRLTRQVRGAVRAILKPNVPRPATSPYPGHYALTRSVVEGLREIGADFNFNPTRLSEVARVVYAPANEALRQAIARKQAGEIDYLVAGPVNALFADETDGILLRPEIDRLIVAHEWQADFVRDFPDAYAKCRACPCGVDTAWWQPPADPPPSRTAVVYWKSGPERFCEQVEAMVRSCGLEPLRVRSMHGEHKIFTPADYRRLLTESAIGIFLSTFETQGLALAEAWSMNVPTLAWDPQGEAQWRGRTFHAASSAPYLTPATGRTWRTLDELEPLLRSALNDRAAFHPRAWVLANMTDAICAKTLYTLIQDGAAGRAAEMPRFKLTIEYAGTRYSGWQIQKNARTVQGEIDRAVRTVTGRKDFELYGSGRTDAGVHALGQVAHLDVVTALPPGELVERLNAELPDDINILTAEPVPHRFHARHHATARRYLYQIARRRNAADPAYVWWVREPLDAGKMREAARAFVGMLDFNAFAVPREHGEDEPPPSTLVLVDQIEIVEQGDLILVSIQGSHFLWKMVRRMIGVLVEVGRGALPPDAIRTMLAEGSDAPARLTAPPSGLFLEQVFYGASPNTGRPSTRRPRTRRTTSS